MLVFEDNTRIAVSSQILCWAIQIMIVYILKKWTRRKIQNGKSWWSLVIAWPILFVCVGIFEVYDFAFLSKDSHMAIWFTDCVKKCITQNRTQRHMKKGKVHSKRTQNQTLSIKEQVKKQPPYTWLVPAFPEKMID